MPGCSQLLPIAVLAAALAWGPVCRGDTKSDIGYTALQARLGSATPTGAGVLVSMVEADDQWTVGKYFPDSASFPGKTLIRASNAATTSFHATDVGLNFFGANSIAQGITTVHVYNTDGWLGSGYLKVGNTAIPQRFGALGNPRVENHSWIGEYPQDATIPDLWDNDALRRFDYGIMHDSLVAVVAVDNGAMTPVPALLGSAFNAIAVGLSNADSSIGPTDAGLGHRDGPGRVKPDIVVSNIAPTTATSYATPWVSASAALLLEVAGPPAGSSTPVYADAYNQPEVIKAILMAGASKNAVTSWVRTAAVPLDLQYGAGQLNIDQAHKILTAGEKNPSTTSTVTATGWSYQKEIKSSETKTYYFDVPAGASQDFSALLTWNSQVNYNSGLAVPDNFQRTPMSSLDLNLKLYQANGFTLGALVDQSISTVDNVEHVFQRSLSAGRYAIRVSAGTLASSWDYGLAWQLTPSTVLPMWNGRGQTLKWTEGANWGGGTPTAPQVLKFGALGAGGHTTGTNDFAADTRFAGITFTSGAASYTLNGNAIQLAGPLVNQSSNRPTIALGLKLASGGGSIDTGSGGLSISGTISGSGLGITKTGSGTLTLSGTNTYSGGTTISAGTLVLASVAALPAGRQLSIGSGGTLVLGGGLSLAAGAAASTQPVPEPSTLALVAPLALAAAGWMARCGRGRRR